MDLQQESTSAKLIPIFLKLYFNFHAFTFSRDIHAYWGNIRPMDTKMWLQKDFTPCLTYVMSLRNISMEANSGGKPNSEM